MNREPVTLEDYVRRKAGGKVNKYKVLYEVWKSVKDKKLRIEDPDPPLTLVSYAFRLEYTLWFWTALALTSLTLLVVFLTEKVPALIPARYVLGTIYVLFLPGYSLVEALYPREEDLSPLERTALSIGLSLATVPLIGLVLNYTPWGIRLPPIITSLTAFTVSMLITALYRKFNYVKINYATRKIPRRF
ncbi:MAG: DUF1616 domain-containing protein [Desulfurococcaceae archaeon]